jgi:hypothetical protein
VDRHQRAIGKLQIDMEFSCRVVSVRQRFFASEECREIKVVRNDLAKLSFAIDL